MKTRALLCLLSAAGFLVLGVWTASGEGSSLRPPKKDALPFQCYTLAWAGTFDVVSTRYDRPNNRVVWVLRAKKDMRVPSYDAFVVDGDGVEQTTAKVKFTPTDAKVKAGKRLEATASLALVATSDVARLTIRLKP